MNQEITIVDRGRGPQLSTSRITVQDLVPLFQRQCSRAEILEIMPVLTLAEVDVIEAYIRDHHEEVAEQDRRIRERAANRVTPPEIEELRKRGRAKMAALREEFARKRSELSDKAAR